MVIIWRKKSTQKYRYINTYLYTETYTYIKANIDAYN